MFSQCLQNGMNTIDAANEVMESFKNEAYDFSFSELFYDVLVKRRSYVAATQNLLRIANDFTVIFDEVKNWNLLDVIILYHDDKFGQIIINPKNLSDISLFKYLKKHSLIAVYVGLNDMENDIAVNKDVLYFASRKVIDLIEGKNILLTEKIKKLFSSESAEKKFLEKPSSVLSCFDDFTVSVTTDMLRKDNFDCFNYVIDCYRKTYPKSSFYIEFNGSKLENIEHLKYLSSVKYGSILNLWIKNAEKKTILKLKQYLEQALSSRYSSLKLGFGRLDLFLSF